MADPTRILVFHEDRATGESVRDRLVEDGFAVTCARSFLDAVPSLAAGRTHLLLIYLPEVGWVRNAILAEVRRANPKLPIVAMTPSLSPELEQVLARLHVATALPTTCTWENLLEALHQALVSPDSPTGARG